MKSNKWIALTCALWTCTWTLEAQTADGFRMEIQVETPREGQILVSERTPDATGWFVDTLQLKDGRALYCGRVKDPRMTTFVLHDVGTDDFRGSFSMFLDNAPEITARGHSFREIVVKGSPATDEWKRIEQEGKDIFRRYGDLSYQRSRAFGDKAKTDSLMRLADRAYNELFEYLTHVPGYATSCVVPYFISEYFIHDTEKLEKALDMLSPTLAGNIYVKSCQAELKRQKRTAIGQPAYDFLLQDLDGRHYRLSDYRGRYLLLEFSASWCGWCKKEIPFLRRVYDEHKDNDAFAMLTVNLDDQRAKWEADVKHDSLPWPVLSDLKGFKGEITEEYNVHGIPAIFLIDPKGHIAATGLRGEEMIETVRRHLQADRGEIFHINGNIDGFDGGWAYVYASNTDDLATDSCRIENGVYTLHGSLEKARKGMVFIQTPAKEFGTMFSVYLQPGEMHVSSSHTDNRYVHTFENAPLQIELDSLLAELASEPAYADYRRLSLQVQRAYLDRGNAPDSLVTAEQTAIVKALVALLNRPGHTRSEALTSVIADYTGLLTPDQTDSLCRRFDPSLHDTFYLIEMRTQVARTRRVSEGQLAPDFMAQDLSGHTHRLSDYRGQ